MTPPGPTPTFGPTPRAGSVFAPPGVRLTHRTDLGLREEWTRVMRWLALSLGLAIAAAALYLLVGGDAARPVASGPPLSDIDDASRARLERVLQEAERAEVREP